ncbi:MHO_1590 family protein [Mycoplasma leonicaptivi]|uniref:MHO_1590 family protein n=1 Tax=Mycoplasma leonicaptivi TaxID=36742 RepID=UPI0004827B29|nr:hypothetical protein [Mycoplasma leonicaptivi]
MNQRKKKIFKKIKIYLFSILFCSAVISSLIYLFLSKKEKKIETNKKLIQESNSTTFIFPELDIDYIKSELKKDEKNLSQESINNIIKNILLKLNVDEGLVLFDYKYIDNNTLQIYFTYKNKEIKRHKTYQISF